MLFPIVGRELRVAARQRGIFWTRLAVASMAILIGIGIFVFTLGLSAAQTGRHIFEWLAGLQFIYCLAYGRRATADCLSQEKRDGTLGLLFLTDLKGHDVVLGKLAATSLKGFYGLLAVLPVLAVPLLLGGTTNGEFWRMVLVLVSTFLFSLAVGVFGSALSRDYRRAMAANLLLLLLFVAAPPAIALTMGYFSGRPLIPELFFTCPAYSFYLCAEKQYVLEADHFWWSLGIVHGLTWLLVLVASAIVPHSWQDQPSRSSKAGWKEFWRLWNFGAASKQSPFRKWLLDINAFYWLAARVKRKPAHVWTFLGSMAAWWLLGWMTSGAIWFDSTVTVLTALMLNCTMKIWVAIVAGQQLAEDKKSGAFELLLTTPLSVRDILHGQLLALRRQFLGPVLAVIAVELLLMRSWYAHSRQGAILATWFAGMIILLTDIAALSWVAMFSALTARSHNQATFRTLLRVMFLPWVGMGLVLAAGNTWYVLGFGKEWSLGWQAYVGLWFGLSLATDLGFGLAAYFKLHKRFRELALRAFNPLGTASPVQSISASELKVTTAIGNAELRTQEPVEIAKRQDGSKSNRTEIVRRVLPWPNWITKVALIFVLGLLILGAGFIALRLRDPSSAPVLTLVTQSNALVCVFPAGGGALFVLPNGSLWRWGQAGGPRTSRAAVPEQVGTNCDWVEAAAAGPHCVGLRKDGTIWEWGWHSGRFTAIPEKADSGHDWIGIAASFAHALALRRDGTLWAWGENSMNQLGNGPGPTQTNLVQIGTNRDWFSVCCPGAGGTLALRTDGSLWAWGLLYVVGSGIAGTMNNLPTPTQVCRETNWVGFTSGFMPLVRSRSDDLWQPFYGVPSADAPAASILHLVYSNSPAGRFAAAFCGAFQVFELRADGTLWQRDFPFFPGTGPPAGKWRQVGKRGDWVQLWSGGGTAFGLTADGTLWTWGIDPTRDPTVDLLSRLKFAQQRISAFFSATPPPLPRTMLTPTKPAYQKQPRPLMRLVPAKSNP